MAVLKLADLGTETRLPAPVQPGARRRPRAGGLAPPRRQHRLAGGAGRRGRARPRHRRDGRRGLVGDRRLARLAPAWRRPWLAALALARPRSSSTDAAPRPRSTRRDGRDRPAGLGAPARRPRARADLARFRAEAERDTLRRPAAGRDPAGAARHRRPLDLRRVLRPLGAGQPALRPDRQRGARRGRGPARRRRPRDALGLPDRAHGRRPELARPRQRALGPRHRQPGPLPRAARQPAPHAPAPGAGRRLADRGGDAGDHPRLARGRLLRLRPRARGRRPRLPRPAVQLGDHARPVHPRRLRARSSSTRRRGRRSSPRSR